jgi:outer membrane protein TolC
MSDSLHTALLNRPDISQAIRDARAASVKLGVAQKDVLPKLDFVASTYVAGLAAGSDGGKAYGNQFSEGRPTFSVGLQFEVPIGNRASHAQANRRRWELNQAMSRFSLTVEEALTSVEVAVREVQTSYGEMVAKHRAMRAAQSEADYLSDRWRVLPNVNDSAAQLLENLLDAQERVADEEQAMVGAQVNYALTLVRLKSEMGTLLRIGDQ